MILNAVPSCYEEQKACAFCSYTSNCIVVMKKMRGYMSSVQLVVNLTVESSVKPKLVCFKCMVCSLFRKLQRYY